MKILLDTNFILHAVEKKLDFESMARDLFATDFEWIVPQEVLNELGNLKDSHGVGSSPRRTAELSFSILQGIKPTIVTLGGKNPNVDISIVNYVLDKDIVVATLDKGLKERIKNNILTIRAGKKLEIL